MIVNQCFRDKIDIKEPMLFRSSEYTISYSTNISYAFQFKISIFI